MAAQGKSSGGRRSFKAPRKRATTTSILSVGDLTIHVTRKQIKNLHLRVQPPDGRIEVSAPHHVNDAFITSFVREKRPWIDDRRSAIASAPAATSTTATPAEQAEWKAVVSACVPALIERWEPILGVKAGKIAYRNMKSRWGSCQPATGRICINTRLALYPPECLEYVVVHELCHLRVSGHGPKFWELVSTALPNWKEARAKLRG